MAPMSVKTPAGQGARKVHVWGRVELLYEEGQRHRLRLCSVLPSELAGPMLALECSPHGMQQMAGRRVAVSKQCTAGSTSMQRQL